ncbi:hypothetical protein Clacol_008746 [Clathrus columnatus]|uniref:von Hippel-Lindau disease tumour suppressor beta domain-containing protein n=1 Tax=Clathrus columnatus TaxID=1419009 RepID=A0AAV5AL46_9AGAM|nr:hypothetical protein Clacol_008746 [Clathrus columnatus]
MEADANVNWIGFNGERKPYKTLGPGESYRQKTFVTHPWEVVAGDDVIHFLPTVKAEYTAVIGTADKPKLTPLGYSESKSLHSKGNKATSITFFNANDSEANVFWIDTQGKHQLYKTLKSKEEYDQDTFLDHPWEVVVGESVAYYMPIDSDAKVFIE